MRGSTGSAEISCRVEEPFDRKGLTAFGGAGMLVDFERRVFQLPARLQALPVEKAPWARWTVGEELEMLLVLRALGLERIHWTETFRHDPWLAAQWGLPALPEENTFYRALERFDSEEKVQALGEVNRPLLERLLAPERYAVLDLDTTVETVYGQQEGSVIGYNPRYHGRPSDLTLLAVEAQSGAVVAVELHSGRTASAEEKLAFYRKAKAQLPPGCPVRYVRGDKAFPSEELLGELEREGVHYVFKFRVTPPLRELAFQPRRWHSLFSPDPYEEIQVASIGYRALGWSRTRRLVLIRTRALPSPQVPLLPEIEWELQAIVTDLPWSEEDVWRFYNDRARCENVIKDLKAGLGIDAIAKADFWPNAADLWIKALAYNLLLALKTRAPEPVRRLTAEPFRRLFLCIPGLLVRHARGWRLHLPAWWPSAPTWQSLRSALASG